MCIQRVVCVQTMLFFYHMKTRMNAIYIASRIITQSVFLHIPSTATLYSLEVKMRDVYCGHILISGRCSSLLWEQQYRFSLDFVITANRVLWYSIFASYNYGFALILS